MVLWPAGCICSVLLLLYWLSNWCKFYVVSPFSMSWSGFPLWCVRTISSACTPEVRLLPDLALLVFFLLVALAVLLLCVPWSISSWAWKQLKQLPRKRQSPAIADSCLLWSYRIYICLPGWISLTAFWVMFELVSLRWSSFCIRPAANCFLHSWSSLYISKLPPSASCWWLRPLSPYCS